MFCPTHTFAENPATGKMTPVRFIRWFDAGKPYARVQFASGYRVSVPANLLIGIVR
jgi:hypothetical protein